MPDLLLRHVRVVPLDGADSDAPARPVEPTDVLLLDGSVAEVGRGIAARDGIPEVDGAGRWALPGLWDHHVHVAQWGLTRSRIDTSAATGVEHALQIVRDAMDREPLPRSGVVVGYGHRTATWAEQPSVAALDALTTAVPVVLISGDAHHGWLNSPALRLLDAPATTAVVEEWDWFGVYDRLAELPGAREVAEDGVAVALREAQTRGVVGVTDLEFGRPWEQWRQRKLDGMPLVRARVGVYPEGLDDLVATGLRTGDLVTGTRGLVRLGPLKVISDGSLNTRTAWCCEPFHHAEGMADPHGAPNIDAAGLADLVGRAHAAGLECAVHAIGDAAVRQALEVFASTGAVGGIEHAQLVAESDLELWSRLPVRASVQPAHLLDDVVAMERLWPDRTGRTFPLRSLLDRGIEVALGSDAPVSPLDPWLAMAAAVHRGPVDGESWHAEQAVTVREALACSVDGQRLRPGARGDVILLDDDPLGAADRPTGEQAAALLRTVISATVVDGELVHGA
ncbi:amidohydrolase [Ornithinimicrobium tianjinense]|uniref:Hydrolase n=1 Tax=Ornithinimicrobium tianjinense TaxID=1195761 RepID=A0A917BGK5_9MICO|nr:amidohydrolase family protein [Ornithinimicrobium tianjinense]GGF41448.1 hydrolase [Ornithinimicrobium tianjinense]